MIVVRNGLAQAGVVRLCVHAGFFAFLFLFVSAITVSGFPLYSTRALGLVAIAWILWCVLSQRSLCFDHRVRAPFILLLTFVGFVATTSILDGAADLRMFGKAAGYILQVLPGAMMLAWLAHRLRYSWQQLFLVLYGIYAVHSVAIVISALVPSVRAALESLIPNLGNIDAAHAQYAFRFRGLFNSTGSGLSAILSIGAILGVAALKGGAVQTRLGKLLWVGGLLAIIWAMLLTGRLGLFVVAGLVLVLFVRLLLMVPLVFMRAPRLWSTRPLPLMVLLGALLLVFALYIGVQPRIHWNAHLPAVNLEWVLRDFVFLLQGDYGEGTIGKLRGMVIFPEDSEVWLLGRLSTFDSERVLTDIGYLRILWAVGVVGSALFYGAGLMMFRVLLDMSVDPVQKKVLLLLAVIAATIEAKEPFFSDLRFSTVYVTIFCFHALRSPPLEGCEGSSEYTARPRPIHVQSISAMGT